MKFKFIPEKKDDKVIYFATIGLSIVSIAMVASASVGLASQQANAVGINMIKQVSYYSIGLVAMMFFYYNFSIKSMKYVLPVGAFILSIMLVATLFFQEVNGARAWLHLLNFSLQPSEFVKVFIILYIAVKLPHFYYSQRSAWEIIKKPAIVFGIWVLFIIAFQGDLGTAVVIVLITLICLLMIQGRTFRPLKAVVRVLLIGFAFILILNITPIGTVIVKLLPISEYQKVRFLSVTDPFYDIYDKTYQLFHSLVAFGRGSWSGVGFGDSYQKFGYLPEARTDFILPIIVEELGVIGLALVFIPYAIILYQLFNFALKIKNDTARIIIIGTIAYFFVHFLLNVGGVSALIPLTGVPLLLVSSGGSSTVCVMSLLGICQNIINRKSWSPDESD